MDRPLSLIFFVVGVILVVYGVNATRPIGSEVSGVFSAPTDKTMWFLLGGVLLSLIGLVGSLRTGRSRWE